MTYHMTTFVCMIKFTNLHVMEFEKHVQINHPLVLDYSWFACYGISTDTHELYWMI